MGVYWMNLCSNKGHTELRVEEIGVNVLKIINKNYLGQIQYSVLEVQKYPL